ncbi:MAG: type III pantothenate kinase [Lentisphaerae bacterium]|nr:type III pantothenate kinase [Lentisphaerota bacterium]
MTCLAIDIGNTSTTLGLLSGHRVTHVDRHPSDCGVGANIEKTIRSVVGRREIDGVVLCSVVPVATLRWRRALKDSLGLVPLEVRHDMVLNIKIDYPRPETIGPDRIANACGAVAQYGAPVIVADFGTALTFDIVSAAGAYIGGVIAPGLNLMADYFSEKTALLPHIDIRGRVGRVGRSTTGAMRIGARVGYRGMVREIIAHLRKDPREAQAALCATGGHAAWVLKDVQMPFTIDPNLTLIGLRVIWDLNRA